MNLKSEATLYESVLRVVEAWASSRSKDPSTKVGAGVYDPETSGLFLGYNGFPSGIPDDSNVWNRREEAPGKFELTKYDLVVHAEQNAARKALQAGANLCNSVLVCTHIPCPRCMRDIVASNRIRTVVFRRATYKSLTTRDLKVIAHIAAALSITLIHQESTQ